MRLREWVSVSFRCRVGLIAGVVGVSLVPPVGASPPLRAQGQAAQTPTPVPVTAFVNVSVVPMDSARVLAGQTVVVQGDRIVALGPVGQVRVPAGAVRVDGTGQFLMPGLADMHVHLSKNVSEYGTVRTNAADVLLAFLANGVTTVREMHSGGKASETLALRRQVVAGVVLGPRIYTAADPHDYGNSPEDAAKNVPELKAAGHDFVKVYSWWGQALYDSVAAAATRVGLRIVGHVPYASSNDEAPLPLERIAADHWGSIEHLLGYVNWATGSSEPSATPEAAVDDTILHRLAVATQRAGVWNCPTLTLLTNNGTAPATVFYLQLVKALRDAGAGLLLGTDAHLGAGTTPGFGIHRELEMLVEAGLTPYEALATGTLNVARFLGTEDSTGMVAVGRRADLVLLRANPLVDIHHTTMLGGVVIGGRWLPRQELDKLLDAVKPDSAAGTTFDVLVRLARREIWQ